MSSLARSPADIAALLAAIVSLVSCGALTDNPSSPGSGSQDAIAIELDSARTTAGVRSPIRVAAAVTLDAIGTTITFTASGGSFRPGSARQDTSAVVDATGRARVHWYAPETPGAVLLSAVAGSVRTDTAVDVRPVPPFILQGLPTSAPPGSAHLVTITLDHRWAGSAAEVVSTGGATITVLGPADGGATTGTRVRPVLSATGDALLSVQLPGAASTVWIVASLHGTSTSGIVVVP